MGIAYAVYYLMGGSVEFKDPLRRLHYKQELAVYMTTQVDVLGGLSAAD